MRRIVPVAALALGLLAFSPSSVHPHGGPPVTDDVLLGSGDISLVTSHGFFTEDDGWAWICEEATGAAMAASVVRTPSRWMVGTVTGLRTSTDGCNWSHDPAFGGINILRVMQDVADPERVWLATIEGLWVVDGAEAPTLEMPMTFSVRHVGQRQDGALLIVGFDGGQPVAELKGHTACVNALAWAPHSSCHICSAGDDTQALIWDLSQMPKDLRSHIRYPSDMFAIQTFMYATYHMKRPQVFYNKEDQWEIPEIDGRIMQPYYTIMKLPGQEREEYILMLPYTPRGKSNLSAWMVARSDDEQYGKLDVYIFPKQKLVFGPSQMVARINQDAEISRQISLWDQRGSSVIQGTLLVIPIEESLVYVRPLYLKADAGKIPELKRVIVGYEDTIAMEPTLDEALEKIFTGLERDLGENISPAPVATGVPPFSQTEPEKGQKLLLSKSDYERIRKTFNRILKSQEKIDQSLAGYRDQLRELGKVLDDTKVLPQVEESSAP